MNLDANRPLCPPAVTTAVSVAAVSTVCGAIDGAICAEQSGGQWYNGFMAGAIGNSVSSLVSSVSYIMPDPEASFRLDVIGRTAGSSIYDFTYEYFETGTVNPEHSAGYAVDVTMDACYSTIAYYYTALIAAGSSVPTLGLSIPTAGAVSAALFFAGIPFGCAAIAINIINEER